MYHFNTLDYCKFHCFRPNAFMLQNCGKSSKEAKIKFLFIRRFLTKHFSTQVEFYILGIVSHLQGANSWSSDQIL